MPREPLREPLLAPVPPVRLPWPRSYKPMKTIRLVRALLAASLLASATLQAQPIEVRTLTLTNGMKVLVHEDHSIPNVALHIFYRVGSRNERPGSTGISHWVEHGT